MTNTPYVKNFTLYNNRGQSVLDSELAAWTTKDGSFEIFGPVTHYSWSVGAINFYIPKLLDISWHLLPDATGFICFEKRSEPDNCLLLDVYGKEIARLTVPWKLTTQKNPKSAFPPTSFWRTSEPYINPVDGKEGEFGVTAWVEYAGMYYFELDYKSKIFLWGKEIRD